MSRESRVRATLVLALSFLIAGCASVRRISYLTMEPDSPAIAIAASEPETIEGFVGRFMRELNKAHWNAVGGSTAKAQVSTLVMDDPDEVHLGTLDPIGGAALQVRFGDEEIRIDYGSIFFVGAMGCGNHTPMHLGATFEEREKLSHMPPGCTNWRIVGTLTTSQEVAKAVSASRDPQALEEVFGRAIVPPEEMRYRDGR